MHFWLGTHHEGWLGDSDVPLFVSHRRLCKRASLPSARRTWALDSGGFTELNMHGRWKTTLDEYVEAVERYEVEIGRLAWAAPMDWMCEEAVVAKTGLSVVEHQDRTVSNYLQLRSRGPFIPVLQGRSLRDYLTCIDLYEDAGVDLWEEPLVGIGSVCRRHSTPEVAEIVGELSSYGLSLHGFGMKSQGLARVAHQLKSADSMAWSFWGRQEWHHRRHQMCGRGDHVGSCANCRAWAMQWRRQVLASCKKMSDRRRENMSEITIDTAKVVVEKAIEFEAWSWDDPDSVTEGDVVRIANQLLEQAITFGANNTVSPAALEILHVVGVSPTSEQSLEAYKQRFGEASTNGHSAPTVTPEDASAMARASAAPVEAQDAPALDISDIFPGYDDLKVADIKKAVLESAASGDLSAEEWQRIHDYEVANEDRKTIRELQPEFKAPEPEPAPEPVTPYESPTSSAVGGFSITQRADGASEYRVPTDDVSAFYEGTSPSRAQQEGLPLPPAVDTSQHPPVLPIDITTVSDQELSRVATQFHSCFARTQWLQSQEEGRERAAEHLEREAERDAYVQAYEAHKAEIPEEKRTQPTALEAARKAAEKDAESAQVVRKYRSNKVRHGIDARELRALASGYDRGVWRITDELNRRAKISTNSHAIR